MWANWVPEQKNISFQTLPIKIGSLSFTIILGTLCIFCSISINYVATIFALKGCESGYKWAQFMSRYTTTMMALFPCYFGRPIIKSIETYSQCWLNIANGCRRLGILILSPLLYWQTNHSTTNFSTLVFSPS